MVLEFILSDKSKYVKILFLSFILSTVSLFFSIWVFKTHASIVMVFFTVLGLIPFMYSTINSEEKFDLTSHNETSLLKRHSKLIAHYLVMFIGITMAITLWYVVLPDSFLSFTFSAQTQAISEINTKISGHYVLPVSSIPVIFLNNIKVLTFCIVFSFLYGAGAIFVLAWNASVIATAMGNFIRVNLIHSSNVFNSLFVGFVRYFLHGIPEISAYFIGGLAGSIVSIAVVNKDWRSKYFNNLMYDVSGLIVIAIFILLASSLIEVLITPQVFKFLTVTLGL